MIDNRIFAQLIWLFMTVIGLLLTSQIRSSVWDIVRSFASIVQKTFPWVIAIVSWLIAVVYLASRIGLWDIDMIAATVWWSLAPGTVLVYDAVTSTNDMKFFARRLKNLLSATVIVEALVTLVEMPLLFELFLVPISFALVVIITLSENKKYSTRTMGSFAKYIALAIGTGLLAFNVWSWISGRVSISSSELVRGVILPIYLTIMFIPILYYLTICSRWELLYKKIKDLTSVGPYIRRLRKRLVLILIVIRVSGLHLKSSRFLTMPLVLDRIFASDQPNEVRKNIQYELEKVRREKTRQRELVEQLEKYAGVTGVDKYGRQLDRREFNKTCEKLEFLHLCHVGRWNDYKHYIVGLKDLIIVETLDSFPSDSFHEAFFDNADSWFIWRRTITGWVFAIGADGPPPSCWYYDGPDPPSGPPREGSNWKCSTAGERSLNWE